MSADNQQGSPLTPPWRGYDPSETTRRAPLKAYLLGALHDGTYNKLHKTFRISQKGNDWLRKLQLILKRIGCKSWIYREGKDRDVYVLETTASFLDMKFDPMKLKTNEEKISYVRGYFDSEGGISHKLKDRFYIQFCQKNMEEMIKVRNILGHSGIKCGKLHNPSKAVDPNYWRFYVKTESHSNFIGKVSSWHPRKYKIFDERVEI
ncbi:MAG: LAGLIDADG family homing endonuclease [Patescibacteria group bacterium]